MRYRVVCGQTRVAATPSPVRALLNSNDRTDRSRAMRLQSFSPAARGMRRRAFIALAALLPVFCAAGGGAAFAQAFPTKPVRLVVPFPPGGPLDAVGRAIADKLTQTWGQSVVVDNRPGAGGNIGADLVAKSPPDGYTVVMGALSTHAVNPSLYPKMPYDA